jgi:hypothetical protein
MKESRLLAAAFVFISTLCLSTNAAAILIEYTAGTYDAIEIGKTNSTPLTFDEIHLLETTQSFELTEDVPTDGLLNNATFDVGVTGSNSVGSIITNAASRSFDLTVDSVVYNSSISQDYTVEIGLNSDTVFFDPGSTVTIDLGINGLLDITPKSVSLISSTGGTNNFVINGTFLLHDVPPVPVPAAVWLFGSGLLGLAGIARRNKTA